MLEIENKSVIDQLRTMSIHLGGDLDEGHGAALLRLDNCNGEGLIYTYDIAAGISVRTYDIKFFKEFSFSVRSGPESPLYLFYILRGHVLYHTGNYGDERIRKGRNIIISDNTEDVHSLTFPNNTHLKICVIILQKNASPSSTGFKRINLESLIEDLRAKVLSQGEVRYFGKVTTAMDSHAKVLIENRRTDLIGRLLVEAAVLNMIAVQLKLFEEDNGDTVMGPELSEELLERIVSSVREMQRNLDRPHTIESLSRDIGISPKKLQSGFRFLFDDSVAGFIKRLRLETGRELLENTQLSVSEICDEIGVASRSYFSGIFKERYGHLPREHRQNFSSGDQVFELSYMSEASVFLRESQVVDIVGESNPRNIGNDVTGCLVYFENSFFQILEGGKKEVLDIFRKICSDPRHSNVRVLWKGYRDKRIFKETGMALVSDRPFSSSGPLTTLNFDIKTLITDDDILLGSTSRMLWQRIRNKIRSSQIH